MQVNDPVCGMQLDTSKAAATEVAGGQTLFFCSAKCHEKYRADPARYLKKAPAGEKGPGARGC